MKKFKHIAVIDVLDISDEIKNEIQSLSENPVVFPALNSKNGNETAKRIGGADAVLSYYNSVIDKNILDACPNIRYIGICGTNLSGIDLETTKKRKISVTNVTSYCEEATAEYLFAQLLSLTRGLGKYQWRSEPCDLSGRKIGIIGLGAVGKQVAILALAFGMEVSYHSKIKEPEWEAKGVKFRSLESLLKGSEIITVHVPKDTKILGEKEFALIQPNAILIDLSLGLIFDLPAFLRWVSKRQNFAIFDGLKKELLTNAASIKNVIGLEKERAAKTEESRDRLGKKFLDNLKNFLH